MDIIDVHHHCFPKDAKVIPWSIEYDLNKMDEVNIKNVIISCPLQVNSIQAHEYNNFISEQCSKNSMYHMLACLGYDDIDKSLKEIELYKNKAIGFALNTHNFGIYIGNDKLNSLFNKLNSLNASVVLHPNHFRAQGNDKLLFTVNDSAYEYTFDTGRAIFDFVLQGKVKRWSNIKWILPHAGGVIPFLAHRVSVSSFWGCTQMTEDDIMNDLKSFYYDLALNHNNNNYQFMKSFVGVDHLLYGTDFPNSGEELLKKDIDFFMNSSVFTNIDKEKILYLNAKKLFNIENY